MRQKGVGVDEGETEYSRDKHMAGLQGLSKVCLAGEQDELSVVRILFSVLHYGKLCAGLSSEISGEGAGGAADGIPSGAVYFVDFIGSCCERCLSGKNYGENPLWQSKAHSEDVQ